MNDYHPSERLQFVPPILSAATRHERWYRTPANARRLERIRSGALAHSFCLWKRRCVRETRLPAWELAGRGPRARMLPYIWEQRWGSDNRRSE